MSWLWHPLFIGLRRRDNKPLNLTFALFALCYATTLFNSIRWYSIDNVADHFAINRFDAIFVARAFISLVCFVPPDVVRFTPARNIIKTLPGRLDAEKAKAVQLALAFDFTDMDEQYSLEIRRGVAVFSEGPAENAAATLKISREVFMRFMLGEIGRDEAITSGKIEVIGEQSKGTGSVNPVLWPVSDRAT